MDSRSIEVGRRVGSRSREVRRRVGSRRIEGSRRVGSREVQRRVYKSGYSRRIERCGRRVGSRSIEESVYEWVQWENREMWDKSGRRVGSRSIEGRMREWKKEGKGKQKKKKEQGMLGLVRRSRKSRVCQVRLEEVERQWSIARSRAKKRNGERSVRGLHSLEDLRDRLGGRRGLEERGGVEF